MEGKLDIKHMLIHEDRLFVIDDNDIIWWSAKGDWRNWWQENSFQGFRYQDAGWWQVEKEIVSVESKNNQLIIHTVKGDLILFGNDPANFMLKPSEGYV